VCRATSDELMALHRKWILADEAKRRGPRKPQAAGAAGGTPDEPGTPVPAPALAPVPAEAVPAEAGPARDPQGEVEPPARHETESVSEDVTPQGPRPGGVPAPRRRTSRKLRVLFTAVAVVALTASAALTVRGLGSDEPSDDGRADAGLSLSPVAPTGRASGSVEPSRSGSPSAEPSRTASSPTAGQKSATPSPSSRRPESDGGVPVHATISSYNWESPCGQYYLFDQAPDDLPPVPAPQDARGWARVLDGVDGGDMKLALTLQGTSGEAVVLNGLHVRVLGRNAPLAWGAYSMGSGCGGGITPQTFDIDLDDSRPRTKPVAGEDAGVAVPAKDFPYRVSSTDVEVFHLDAHVEGHDVTWYLELEWTSGGRSGMLRIDDGGKPFRTSSLTARPSYYYRSDTAQWVPEEWGPEGQ
jgi:hypothetical protein